MLVLANKIFNSPPVFACVLPVVVRLQPGKEETFSPVSLSRIFVFSTSVVEASSLDYAEGSWEGPGQGQGQA
jgi:hypothetical protein